MGDFDGIRSQGIRVTVDVHGLGDDDHLDDPDTLQATLMAAIDQALGEHLAGEYIATLKVTRLVS